MRHEPTPGSQAHTVLTYIRRHGSISPREAMQFGCYRLAARVKDLRDMGYPIVTEGEEHEGGTHARYTLAATEIEVEDAGQLSLIGSLA